MLIKRKALMRCLVIISALISVENVASALQKAARSEYDLARSMMGGTYPSVRANRVTNGTTLARYGEVSEFAEHGPIKTLQLGQGAGAAEVMVESWFYNNRLQPVETRLRGAGSAQKLLRLEYFYCAGQGVSCGTNNGNVRSQRISYEAVGGESMGWTGTQVYGYDRLNRLTTFTEGAATETNNYDTFGNRWVTEVGGGLVAEPLTPGGPGWFSGTNNRMTGVGYDGAGNQTQLNPYTLSYDAEGRVLTVTSGVNNPYGSAVYGYDGDGRRVKKTVNGAGVTVYVYDGFGKLAAEYGLGGTGSGLEFLTGDHLGSVRLVTGGTGNVVRRHDYRPFGEDLTGVNGRGGKYGDVKNVRRYTGKERDAETGLDYFGARYLSSAQGRFTSPDIPLIDQHIRDPQSWNLYTYGRNNPLRNVDPTGNVVETLWDIANVGLDLYSLGSNLYQGNFGSAAVDAGGLILDAAATMVPFLPGGAGTAIKAARTADSVVDSARATDRAADARKLVPNPFGKKGGPAHQAKVDEVVANVESRGLTAQKEVRIDTPGGNKKKRYADVAARDDKGQIVEIHQVGKQTKGGTPVSRERRAMEDIERAKKQKVEYHPYN